MAAYPRLIRGRSQTARPLRAFTGIIAAMRFAAILVLTAGVLAAQPATSALQDWGNLKRLAPGEEIRVSTSDGKSYRGALRNVADDSLIVVTAAGEQSLARAQVVKAAFKKQGHRARNTLIG